MRVWNGAVGRRSATEDPLKNPRRRRRQRQSGKVWAHDVDGTKIGPAFALHGSKVAFNGDDDRLVMSALGGGAVMSKVYVLRWDGRLFRHEAPGNTITDPVEMI